jgi:hypothetical protein
LINPSCFSFPKAAQRSQLFKVERFFFFAAKNFFIVIGKIPHRFVLILTCIIVLVVASFGSNMHAICRGL